MTFLADTDLSVRSSTAGAFPTSAALRSYGAVEGTRPPPFVARIRFQLPCGLLVGAVAPFLLTSGTVWEGTSPSIFNTGVGLFVAIVAGYYALRKISNFPTMREVGSVLPVFTASFAAVMALVSLAGFDYARVPFVLGYALTVAWFTGVLIVAQRVRTRRFVLVPVGESRSMLGLQGATWHVADSSEKLPGSCNGVVADLRAEIPAHWQQYLTSCALAGIPVYH